MPPIRHDRPVRRALVLACAAGLAGAAPLADAEAVTAPAAAQVSGTVVGPGGEPAVGAIVAVVARNRSEPAAVTVADAGGAFTATVPAGTYALTATHPQWVAAYSPPAEVSEKAVRDLRLAAPAEGFLLAGDVRDFAGASLGDARVQCVHNRLRGDHFIGRSDGAGHYALRLPSTSYGCRAVVGEERTAYFEVAAGTSRQDLVLRLPVPAPQAVIDWIRGQAVPLLTSRAGHGFADFAPLADVVGGARVVALGEATHGTREHFQMKHRLLEYLVSELGFSVFAMENNWPESETVDEYVRTGHGDLTQALSELFLVYNTEEVLDLIRWMRQWNALPGHRQVRFYGFDMQAGAMAADRLTARLQVIDATLAAEVVPALAKLAADERADGPTDEGLAAVAAVLPRIAERLETQGAAADRQALVDRHYVQVLRQYTEQGSDPLGNGQVRDRAMADNVRWVADVAEPGSRLVLWAHNGHIGNHDFHYATMGHHLEAELGKDYLPVGFLFHHGGLQAVDATGGRRGLSEFTVGPPPAGTLEDTFERAGWPLCLLDLRRLPASGPVAEWFRSPHPMREIGASFRGEADMATEVVLPDRYEAVIFFEATTRARPNPKVQP